MILFTLQPGRYFNWIKEIYHLQICISINYNLFLTSCVLRPAHMASFVNLFFFSRKETLIFWNITLGYSYNLQSDLRIHWRLSTILKTSNKSVWRNAFWYVKVCIFWKCMQYTMYWNKAKMLKKVPLDKINGKKDALFFLSRAPSHHSFTFNLRFLYELKLKIRLSKACVWDFPFSILFHFYLSLYSCSTKYMDSLTLERHNSFLK